MKQRIVRRKSLAPGTIEVPVPKQRIVRKKPQMPGVKEIHPDPRQPRP
jgi:hypothetical protein